ncbi:CHAT domain-containing protein [Actinoplanes sp. LDG1-06]|uniref:CHAT domain-containing protein n=1 Tax=Paractinoplanes ovalisporus TaxID=2810368 RepID=A0ABS2APL4_9ACTN|nr:CHAT domain-containing protein [Actinoplanes ovalisporus]MBM2621808.1 CHAT domain-containing protein [Actinoplanes ovalisporus]
MRDDVAGLVKARVDRYEQDGDSTVLTEAAAEEELRELYGRLDEPGAAQAAVAMHMARHNALPDLEFGHISAAIRLLRILSTVDPSVPPEFNEALEQWSVRATGFAAEGRQLLVEAAAGDEDKLAESVRALRKAFHITVAVGGDANEVLEWLANAMRFRHLSTGDAHDLNALVEYRRQLVAIASADHPKRPLRLQILGEVLRMRYRLHGQTADLAEAVSVNREALDTTKSDHHLLRTRRANLGASLHDRYLLNDLLDDLDESIELTLTSLEPGEPHRGDDLTARLVARYDRSGSVADLDSAVKAQRHGLAAATDRNRAPHLNNLGTALFRHYERLGDLSSLDEAINVEEQALVLYEPDDPERARAVANLTASLRLRYQRTRTESDLDRGIDVGSELLSGAEEASLLALSTVAVLHAARYERYYHEADFDRAELLSERAVALVPKEHRLRPVVLQNSMAVMRCRLDGSGAPAKADEIIRRGREAVRLTSPQELTRHVLATILAQCLIERYGVYEHAEDLIEAMRLLEETVIHAPAASAVRPRALTNLAAAYHWRARTGGSARTGPDLDRAVALSREVLGIAGGTDREQLARGALAAHLVERGTHRPDRREDLVEAVGELRIVAEDPAAPVAGRIDASGRLGRVAAFLGDQQTSTWGYERAIELLPTMVWHGLTWTARHRLLKEEPTLACDAAASLIRSGEAERAMVLLEQGRSVVWNQILRMRNDFAQLSEVAPDEAVELLRIRERLDLTSDDVTGSYGPLGPLPPETRLERARERAELAVEWDRRVRSIRRRRLVPDFLEPTGYAALAEAAAGGTVVVVNVSTLGCHAILVREDAPPEVLDLAPLTLSEVADQAVSFGNALRGTARSDRSFLERDRDRHIMLDVLEWLWDRIARPVLDRLSPPASSDLPRIWWCPTGYLNLLPLHAAGRHHRHARARPNPTKDTVLDRVVSSYTPTLSALVRARSIEKPSAPPHQVAVGMPETRDRTPLPRVNEELSMLRRHFPSADHLIGPDATIDRVRAALPSAGWAHFACHAEQDGNNPGEGAFLLFDGRLTMTDLASIKLPAAQFAYLSACDTAFGGVQLLDEAAHLAAATQLAGFPHVVACLWRVPDDAASNFAAQIYDRLASGGAPDPAGSAHAVHEAITTIRASHPGDPWLWAPYVHFGR